jgi:hypothetical protein
MSAGTVGADEPGCHAYLGDSEVEDILAALNVLTGH